MREHCGIEFLKVIGVAGCDLDFESSLFHASPAAVRTSSKSHPGISAARLACAPSTDTGERATFTSSCSAESVVKDARPYMPPSPLRVNVSNGLENSATKYTFLVFCPSGGVAVAFYAPVAVGLHECLCGLVPASAVLEVEYDG